MTIPMWCLLIGCFLPLPWIGFTAKARLALPEGLDNNNTRGQQARLTGMAARAVGAHHNAFEALPLFMSAVFIQHSLGGDTTIAAGCAVAWVVFRVLHGAFYVAGIDMARSLCFGLATIAAVALIFAP